MTSPYRPVPARVATRADTDAIISTMTTAFFDDPLGGPAFRRSPTNNSAPSKRQPCGACRYEDGTADAVSTVSLENHHCHEGGNIALAGAYWHVHSHSQVTWWKSLPVRPTRGRVVRKPLMVLVVAVMAAIGFAAPAQATVNAVDMPFGMAYGNSTTTGKIHFTDGYTASVSGTVHAASGARRICAYGVNGSTTSGLICSPYAYAGGPNTTLSGALNIPQPGGVVRVYITMYDENNSGVARLYCTRIGCTREY